MTQSYPLLWQWDGEAMRPRPVFAREADRRYVIGQDYRMDEIEDRSTKTHNHEFAWLSEVWKNLPETISDQFPTAEHLRKRLLIDAGFYREQIIEVGSSAGALRVAAAWRGRDDFAFVVVRGPIVVIREAKSQSRRAMDKAEFQASKTAIMELAAELIGVPQTALTQIAARDSGLVNSRPEIAA